MKLKAGTTLQNHKYVVEEVLQQDELEMTCRAIHTLLDQPVILQTFSETGRQRSDFAQLQQQFLDRMRHLAQHPTPDTVQVLDCFKEAELPIVVLKWLPQQVPPALKEWLSLTVDPSASVTSAPLPASMPAVSMPVASTPATQTTIAPTASPLEANTQPPEPAIKPAAFPGAAAHDSANPSGQEHGKRYSEGHTGGATIIVGPRLGQTQNPTRNPTRNFTQTLARNPLKPNSKPKPRLPIALMLVALVGGAVGAGMGFAMRLADAPQEGGRSRLSLFNREQSFPATGSWPVQEDVPYTPDWTVEQPLYRSTPSSEYDPSWIAPAPADSYVPEAIPAPEDIPSPEFSPIPEASELPESKTIPDFSTEVDPYTYPPSDPGFSGESLPPIDSPPVFDPVTPPAAQPVLPPIDTAPPSADMKPLPESLGVISQ